MTHYVVFILFFLFGALQYNDPDFYLWGPVYFITSIIALLYLKNRLIVPGLIIWIAILIITTCIYIPDIVQWISGGMENIAGSMKAESPHIELTREFFGLLLCMSTSIVYFYLHRKRQRL